MELLETIVDAHLDAWNAPAGPDRTRAIADVYTEDVLVAEPDDARDGHRGVDEAISALQAQLPGTAITRTGPLQVSQDMVTYPWALGPRDDRALATGRDVLLLAGARISRVYVVIDAP